MTDGVQLILWIAGVHLIGLVGVAVLLFPALKDNPIRPERPDSDDNDGWGRGPRRPPSKPEPPRGGIPLPDAVPARVRLREHGRLGERLPGRERRPIREPARTPSRTPHRARSDWDSRRRFRSGR
ncbi:MAG: hypothetical protein ABSH51_22280 [Solirubrobacteraceae bacterium]|jgi:hypothetical protein